MKTNIHPQWYLDATITCACGHVLTVGSTKQTVRVEICSKCHPFFTGQMKYIDTQGRVEKFQKKQAYAQTKLSDLAKKKLKKKGQVVEDKSPKTLREMLLGA